MYQYALISSCCLFLACSKDSVRLDTQTRLSKEEALKLFVDTTHEYQKGISLVTGGEIEFEEIKTSSAKIKANYNLLLKLEQNKSAQIYYLSFNKDEDNRILIKFTPEVKSSVYDTIFRGLITFYEEKLVAQGMGF